MFLSTMRAWYNGTINWHLDQQARIARERILRGIEDGYGIREAHAGSLRIYPGKSKHVDWLDFDCDGNTIPTPDRSNDDVTCRLLVNPGHPELHARTTPGSGKPQSLLSSDIHTEALEFDYSNRRLTVDFTISLNGSQEYERRLVLSSYLVND